MVWATTVATSDKLTDELKFVLSVLISNPAGAVAVIPAAEINTPVTNTFWLADGVPVIVEKAENVPIGAIICAKERIGKKKSSK